MSFNIEARKVQKTGGSSYIISLPKEWINKHGIEAKDTVGILSQPDGNLLVTPYMSSEKYIREKKFDVDEINGSDFLFRLYNSQRYLIASNITDFPILLASRYWPKLFRQISSVAPYSFSHATFF